MKDKIFEILKEHGVSPVIAILAAHDIRDIIKADSLYTDQQGVSEEQVEKMLRHFCGAADHEVEYFMNWYKQSHPIPISEGEIEEYLMEEIGDDPDELELIRGIGMRKGIKWAQTKGVKLLPEISDKEIDKMAVEYSKETLGAGYREGKLPATSLEVGFIDGYKTAKGVKPISEGEIEEVWNKYRKRNWPHEYTENSGCINEQDFKAAIKELNK